MKRCSRCIYDETIPNISFDSNGECNYCKEYDRMNIEYPTGDKGWSILEKLASKIKEDQKDSKYDVVVGVSGGCDSSYTYYIAKKLGLRVLAVHFDNTWNTAVAVENIINLLRDKGDCLHAYVVSKLEYNDIFKAFIRANIPDIDAPTDLALATVLYQAAEEYNIKYIFEGHSFRTEGIAPIGWVYMDAKYIYDVHSKFGTVPMKSYPNLWLKRWFKWMFVDKIKKIRPLYYIDYDKEKVKKLLADEYGWQWYGGHHMENVTAYFTNNFWFPRFGIDLRISEYAAMVRSGLISREEALEIVNTPHELDEEIIAEVKKRLNFSDEEFDYIINKAKKRSRSDFRTYKPLFEILRPIFYVLYKTNFVTKSFYIKYCIPEKAND